MANIVNQQTTQVNITFVPKNQINSARTPGDQLELKIKEIYGDSSKPIITKFPNVFVLFDPNNQVAVNILSEQNRIIIGDNRVTPYASRDLSKFIQFTKSSVDIILKETQTDGIIAYGLNISTVIDVDQDDSSKFLVEKFINKGTSGVGFIGGGIKLIFKDTIDGDECRFTLQLDPRFAGLKLTSTKSIQINQNSHFENVSLPDLTKLNGQINRIYSGLPTFLAKIL
jgi:hypothetical protein